MRDIPLSKFQISIPVYMSPRATFRLFQCEWCREETPQVGIYSSYLESIVLCDRCANTHEAAISEFLAMEYSREWLKKELAVVRDKKIVNFSQARRKRGKETSL